MSVVKTPLWISLRVCMRVYTIQYTPYTPGSGTGENLRIGLWGGGGSVGWWWGYRPGDTVVYRYTVAGRKPTPTQDVGHPPIV